MITTYESVHIMFKKVILLVLATLLLFGAFSYMSYRMNSESREFLYGNNTCKDEYMVGCQEYGFGMKIGFPLSYGYITTPFTNGNPYGLKYDRISKVNVINLIADVILCGALIYFPYRLYKILRSAKK